MKKIDKEARERMDQARAYLQYHEPYFGVALWAIKFVEVPGMIEKSAGPLGTDMMWRVYYDPDIVKTLDIQKCAATLSHELHHLIRKHKDRAEYVGVSSMNWRAWNLCADAEINQDLEKITYIDRKGLPWAYATPRYLNMPEGQTAEVYYSLLPKQESTCSCGNGDPKDGDEDQKGGGGGGDNCPQHSKMDCGSGAHGHPQDWEEDSGKAASEQGAEPIGEAEGNLIRKQTAEEIMNHVKSQGTVPAGLLRWAQNFGKPTIDWHRRLRRLVRGNIANIRGRSDYTYQWPHRRQAFFKVPFIMPSMVSPTPEVAIVIDTSGSMSEDELRMALAESQGVLTSLGLGKSVTVFSVDAAASQPQKVTSVKNIKLTGGGGTDMRIGIAAAEENNPKLDLIIVMTDGETPWPEAKNKANVIACLTQQSSYSGVPGWIETVVIRHAVGPVDE